jgi:hypothetical protein
VADRTVTFIAFVRKLSSCIQVTQRPETGQQALVHHPSHPEDGHDPSADLFGQLDDDSLGAADVAEAVAVLVAHQLADELGAAGL